MESTGKPGRIQISNTTATLLTAAGKTSWIKPREDVVLAKGKGVINTFWLNFLVSHHKETASTNSSVEVESVGALDEASESINKMVPDSQERLVDWVAELLMDQLKKIVSKTFWPV